jgi:hypothetical protein
MSTNLFAVLRRLLPDAPVILARVISHDAATDTSVLELPAADPSVPVTPEIAVGSTFTARGRTVAVGQRAFVRDGVVESQAPEGEPEEIVVGGTQVYAPLVFVGPLADQALTVAVPYGLSLPPLWAGGVPPYRYTVRAGTLPAGLSLDALTGALTGTPTTVGTSAGVVLRVTDASAIAVDAPPVAMIVVA